MLLKVMNETGQSAHGVDVTHAEYLPPADQPGEWMPPIEGALVYQQIGYHCGDENQILEWLGPSIYEVEHEGELLEVPRAKVARRIRLLRKCSAWSDQAARTFAVECALRVLPLFTAISDSPAPQNAIDKALAAPPNLYSLNPEEITPEANQFAEEMDALKTLAEDAASAVEGQSLEAMYVAMAAAHAASAYSPGCEAAKYAAQFARLARGDQGPLEREWQVQRLLETLNG